MSEKEEEKIGMASGGISPDEEKLVHALHLLWITPKLSSTEEVAKLISIFAEPSKGSKEPVSADSPSKYGSYQFPKLSQFYGEDGKGDANWETFRYEIRSLISDKMFKEEQILLGIRRACKGKAADNLRRLGHEVTLHEVLEKFDSDYGSIESRESIMRKFYGCQQGPRENVTSFAARLEDLFEQAVSLKAVKKSDTAILKEVLYAGLNRDLKHLSIYHCDKIKNYDEFKRELRKLEASLSEKDLPEEKVTCKATKVDSQSSEMKEIKELLLKLNERIDVLEKTKEDQRQEQECFRGYGRGLRGRGRGQPRGRGQWQGGRGRGGQNDYQQQRPLGNQNFQPTCFKCNKKGHKQDTCPSNNVHAPVTCYNCGQIGHKQWNCPN